MRCFSTVLWLTYSAWAISRFERPVRGQRGDPPLVGGEGVDPAELRPARPRAGDQQLGPGALGERRGAAADREIERLAERLAGLDDAAAVAERDAEVGERAGVLEPGR